MPTEVVSLSEFKAKASQMLAEMKAAEHEIVLTQRGAASAVVQDFDAYERQRSALLMLKLMVQGEADIQAGRTTPQDRVFAEIKAGLTARGETPRCTESGEAPA